MVMILKTLNIDAKVFDVKSDRRNLNSRQTFRINLWMGPNDLKKSSPQRR